MPYTEEEIVAVIKAADAGAQTTDLSRRRGIPEPLIRRWQRMYAGLNVIEVKRLRALEEKNSRLKRLVILTILGDARQGWTGVKH